MLFERQSNESGYLQLSKAAPLPPPLHAFHPANSWQPPLSKGSFSSLQSPELATQKVLKRSRSQEEIGRFGESVSRKKRRLRHELVTSRLSRPYATPATHIAQGAWRLGVWARQRSSGDSLLRKGAILNSIAKRKRKALLESMKKTALHEANMKPKYGNTCCTDLSLADNVRSQPDSSNSLSSQASPKCSVFASSDYDAFDREESESSEDEDEDEEEDEEEDEDDTTSDELPVYSDFRMLNSSDADEEFGDASYSFDTLDSSYHLGIDHGEKAIHLVMENEKQDEVSVAPITSEILHSSLSGLVAVGD